MDTTNNPGTGIGSATETNSGADTFKALLDSETAATNIERTGTEAKAITSEDEIESDVEQPLEDSENVDLDETEDAADGAEEQSEELPSDDLIVGRDDSEKPVTLKELREAGMRLSDYTKKTQEIAALRKQWVVNEVNKQELRSEWAKELDGLMIVVSQEFDLEEPNWEAEWDENPYEAQKKKFAWDKKQQARIARLQQIHAHQQALAKQKEQVEFEEARQRKIDARQQLAEEMPNEFGGEKGDGTLGAIRTFLGQRGVPDHMIQQIDNAEIIKIAYDAMLYRQLQAQKAQVVKKVEATPALVMPGTASKKSSTSQTDRLIKAAGNGQITHTDLFKHLLK